MANPAGRPKGSRNKLTEKFLTDIEKDWKKYGKEVLEKVRLTSPEIYLRVISGLIAKHELNIENDEVSVEDAREELLRRLNARYPITDEPEIDRDQAVSQALISS